MGNRGPKSLPANVLALRGSTAYLQKRESEGAIKPEVEIPGCPRHLLAEARKEWKRSSAELETLGLISRIDRTALALDCQEYAWWVWHEEGLQRAIKLRRKRQQPSRPIRLTMAKNGWVATVLCCRHQTATGPITLIGWRAINMRFWLSVSWRTLVCRQAPEAA